MADEVKIGFIGCGGVQQKHMAAIAGIEGAKMVAFCDLKAELAGELAEKYGGKPFTDHKEMLKEELDAVWIALPPFAHGPELDVIEAGLPFFVEKPIGLDIELCKKIADAVEAKGLITSVGYMSRYRKGVQRAREILEDDPAAMAYGGWIGKTPSMDKPIHQWWVVKEKSGGQLVEQATHTVDLVRYLFGEVEEVYSAATRGFVKDIPIYTIDDASLTTLKFRSGTIVTIYATCIANAGGVGVSLNIYAPRHTIKFSGWALDAEILAVDSKPETIKGEGDIFRVEDEIFINAVRTGDASGILCDYADGLKTAEVTLAGNRSMETGEPIKL